MATEMVTWLFAIPLLGLATGLRSMTPIAIVCWFGYLGYLPVHRTWARWTTTLTAVIIFTLFAVGELIADKLPRTPNRTSPGPLLARLVLGGLVGSIAAAALRGPGLEGTILGVIGAAIGTFAGFMLRRELVSGIDCPDWIVAVSEDLFTILFAVFALHVITN